MGRLVGKRAVETSIDIASGSIPIYNKEYRIWETINLTEVSGSDFPFTGSAVISGSLTVEGTTNLIGSSGSTVMTMNTDTMVFTGSFITTGSIENTGSLNVYGTINATSISGSFSGTASYALDSNLLDGRDSSTFATTASNTFDGTQTITGGNALKTNLINNVSSGQRLTIDPDNSNYLYVKLDGFDDGGERISIGNTFPSSAGIYYYTDGGYYWRMYQNLLRFPDDTWQATAFTKQAVLNEGFATTGSNTFNGDEIVSGSVTVVNGITGSLLGTASYAIQALTASHALTASSADNLLVRNVLSGSDALFSGTITAQTLHVQTVSSSVVYSTGSNKLGSTLNDIQQLTGSVGVTGSLTLNNIPVLTADQTGSFTVSTASFAFTASYVNTAQTASYVTNAFSASYVSGSNVKGTVSSSYTASIADNAYTASYVQNAQTASYVVNAFTSSYISGSDVKGTVSSSYTASLADNATSASYALTASYAANVPTSASYTLQALSASYAATASSADDFFVRNVLSGSDAVFTGTITAQTLHVQTVSSSVVYSTGSNKLGSLQSDVQQLTGSVGITGSLRTVGSATFGNGSATANGEYAIAFGSNNHANGNYSIAHGGSSQANGIAAHAEGNSTQANGNWSHTEGNSTVVSAGYGHAEGISTTVGSNGDYAHAEGESTLANGRAAHAEGLSTAAIGESSHAEGRGTIASGSYQHAEGTFNLKGNTTSLLVIGNGTDNNNRSDIVRIDPTNVQITGSLSVTSGITGSLEGTAATASYVVTSLTSSYVSGSNVKGTVSSSYTASIADNAYTASYIQNAQTASYVINALSASYISGSNVKGTVSSSLTASIADNAYTASYVQNALTASYVQNALTASYISGSNVNGTVSSSYTASISDNAYSASYISGSNVRGTVSSSYTASIANNAYTASYVVNAISSSYVNTASYALDSNLLDGQNSTAFASTGSNTFSGSQYIYSGFRMYTDAVENYSGNTLNLFGDVKFNGNDNSVANNLSITGSLNAPNITGSLLGTSSYAISSSAATYSNVAISSSFASTASYVLNSISASYITTASYAISGLSSSYAGTSSLSERSTQVDVYVKNQTGVQINKGTVVRIIGAVGDNPLIQTASYTNDSNSANTLGITTGNIANGGFGYVVTTGVLIGIDTSTPGWSAGQLLYLGPNGTITGSAPVAPLHSVRLGEVLRVQQNNGSIFVSIDNGYELGELHDVRDTSTTSSFGDLLVKSGSVWTNSNQLTGSYGLTGSLTATSFIGNLTGTASNATFATTAVTSSYPFFVTGSQYAPNSSIVTSLDRRNFAPDVEESVLLGVDAGVGSNEIFQNVIVGKEAGASTTNAAYMALLGYQAGYSASNAQGLVAIGAQAGYAASQSRYNNIIGGFAGNSLVNVEYSTAIGSDSLNSAMSSYGLIAIGNSTGNNSKKNNETIFIGNSAGSWAVSSSYSTFVGLSAGYGVKNTTSSIFIGNNTGRGPGNVLSNPYYLGRNNIIIGTDITLPVSSSDSINIGGLIFGTGSHYSDAFNPTYFSGSANGKIGINQPLPKYELDVAGAGNFTNGLVITGSVVATSFTGSFFGTSSWAQKAVTASYAVYADAVGTIVSGAIVTTGSNIFIGNQTISGSATITGNLTVYGTSSFVYVTASQLFLTASFLSLNIFEPAERFGGIIVYDSGSLSHQATASLAWDSLKDRWVYQNASGSTYSGGIFISGPRNTGSLGDEPTLTNGRIPKSVGGDHIDNSIMSEISSSISVSGSLTVTGSLNINNVAFNGNTTGVITGGNQVLVSTATGSFTSAFYNYTLASGSNARAGQFIVVWNGTTINYTDVSTTDIGNTSNVILTASLSGNNVNVSSLIPSNNWVVKTTVNLL